MGSIFPTQSDVEVKLKRAHPRGIPNCSFVKDLASPVEAVTVGCCPRWAVGQSREPEPLVNSLRSFFFEIASEFQKRPVAWFNHFDPLRSAGAASTALSRCNPPSRRHPVPPERGGHADAAGTCRARERGQGACTPPARKGLPVESLLISRCVREKRPAGGWGRPFNRPGNDCAHA